MSERAEERGQTQIGTLGSGNHFAELQYVAEIFDEDIAASFGLFKDQITVMIHSGSRGLGHQVCTDHLRVMGDASRKYGISLPDRQLACAPIDSAEGRNYLAAMAAAANFAFANRQVMAHWIRESFGAALGIAPDRAGSACTARERRARIHRITPGRLRAIAMWDSPCSFRAIWAATRT